MNMVGNKAAKESPVRIKEESNSQSESNSKPSLFGMLQKTVAEPSDVAPQPKPEETKRTPSMRFARSMTKIASKPSSKFTLRDTLNTQSSLSKEGTTGPVS